MTPSNAMLRYPALSKHHLAFVHAGDIWLAERPKKTSGKISVEAHRLTSAKGEEQYPRFSPNGERIAFSANYDGNVDIYVLNIAGDEPPHRITHHPQRDRLLDWYPDGEHLLFASTLDTALFGFSHLYKVPVGGGLPEPLPIPYAEFAAVHPDGETIAFQPTARDFIGASRWPGQRGGKSPDIWRYAPKKKIPFKRLTQTAENEASPLWGSARNADGSQIYFLSDRAQAENTKKPAKVDYYNLWTQKLAANGKPKGKAKPLTNFRDFDVRHPDLCGQEILFEQGGTLYLFDLKRTTQHEVEVCLLGNLSMRRRRTVSVGDSINHFDLSPNGRRAVFEARGDIFTVPREHGIVRNLTRSNSAHRYPAWSPDGKLIAYWSDRPCNNGPSSPEYQLYLQLADGSGPPRCQTSFKAGFRYRPFWCPRSQKLAFIDQELRIQYWDIEKKELILVDNELSWMNHSLLEEFTISWSPGGRWLAYSRKLHPHHEAIFLFDTDKKQRIRLTSSCYNDFQPSFDRGGRYLYFLTQRTLPVVQSDLDPESDWVVANSTSIAVAPLTANSPDPYAARNEEEIQEVEPQAAVLDCECWDLGSRRQDSQSGGQSSGQSDGQSGGQSGGATTWFAADFERRLQLLKSRAGNYDRLQAHHGKVFYLRRPNQGEPEGRSELLGYQLYQTKTGGKLDFVHEEQSIRDDVEDFVLHPHCSRKPPQGLAQRLLVRHSEDGFSILQVSDDLSGLASPLADDALARLPIDQLEKDVDPAAEWRQIFQETWRLVRDYFPKPELLDNIEWEQLRQTYVAMLDRVSSRWDLDNLVADLCGNLGLSHFIRYGGDFETAEQRGVGLLGVDFQSERQQEGKYAFQIQHILDGGAPHCEVRSPLRVAGVQEGSYLLAINGTACSEFDNPWQALQGLDQKTVVLRVGPSADGKAARTLAVKTLNLAQEIRLRQLAWIEKNRERVAAGTRGRVGYVFLAATSLTDQLEFFRQLRPQAHLEGLILDNRFNCGGNYPDRLVEILNRRQYFKLAHRAGQESRLPLLTPPANQVMLIDGWTGSCGELLAHLFRATPTLAQGQGDGPLSLPGSRKLVGTATAGALLGVAGVPNLIDGGYLLPPDQVVLSPAGEWLIEGKPVQPDVEVEADLAKLAKDEDAQLERAIEEVLKLIDGEA